MENAIDIRIALFPLQEKDKERDVHGWLLCTSRTGHDPDKLMPTQIIAGKALECMGHLVHSFRRQWNIQQFCDCAEALRAGHAAAAAAVEPAGANGAATTNGIGKVRRLRLTLGPFRNSPH